MRVLIADDDSTSRALLQEFLQAAGHEPILAEDGEAAWAALSASNPPRIAVLDWMMPGADGLTLCRRIREREKAAMAGNDDAPADGETRYTCVLLLTARDEEADVGEAYEAGVDDFLAKPCNFNELRHRLNVGARVVQYEEAAARDRRRLADYARRMEDLAEQRARQLLHADRMATLGALAAGLAHEVNNPATFISGNLQIIRKCWPALSDAARVEREHPGADVAKLDFSLQEFPQVFDGIEKGVRRISGIVQGLRAYAAPGGEKSLPCRLAECVEEALRLCSNALKYHMTVETRWDPETPSVSGRSQEFTQVFVNLFMNAAQAAKTRGEGRIEVAARPAADGRVRVVVQDDGPGVAPEHLERVWQPFFTTNPSGEGLGLGLCIVQKIIESRGGAVRLENRPEGGARFTVDLPAATHEAPESEKP